MKLGKKLLLAPLLTAGVVLAVSQVISWMHLVQEDAILALADDKLQNFKTMTGATQHIADIHANTLRTAALVSSMDEAAIKKQREEFKARVQEVKKVIESVASGEFNDETMKNHIKGMVEAVDIYGKQAEAAIKFSTVDVNAGVAALQRAHLTYQDLLKKAAATSAYIEQVSDTAIAESRSGGQQTTWLLSGLCLATAVVAVTAAWKLQAGIVKELGRAVRISDQVASGNLLVDVSTRRTDEVGQLMRALGSMVTQLNQSITTVQQSSDSIRQSSAEIAAGNHDLSERTEQTANQLQRASGSTEQLTGTVLQSAESARQANSLAASAAAVAARGGEVVSQVVHTMQEINASARKISDIIGVIDGIAFQTNILALNAAVEAARAGEQGRGFAVVASEVRSLAGRSADAAKEIKSLIGMSVAKVDSGTRLVADAGQTMTEIVGSVQRVSDMISEISAASTEQSKGIGEVNVAVMELDQMTQQNSALVEQSAAAAESLREQTHKLAEVVSIFKLRETHLLPG